MDLYDEMFSTYDRWDAEEPDLEIDFEEEEPDDEDVLLAEFEDVEFEEFEVV